MDLVSPTTGSVIADTTLQQTPLVGQNVYGLGSALTPGMTGSATTSADNFTTEYAININAAGLRQEQNGFMIDGAYTNSPSRGGGTSISPNPEIVQSMNVETNNFDAQKGRNGGATVDVFTNSGSKQSAWHGGLLFSERFPECANPVSVQSSGIQPQRNEMGATMGGPAFKNKLFWFGAIDVLRSSAAGGGQFTVETQDFDNWVAANLPNTIAASILKTAPPGSFPTTNLKTVAEVEAANPGYYPPPVRREYPDTLNAIGNVHVTYNGPKDGYQWSFRVDEYLGKNDRIYVDAMRTYATTARNTAAAYN